MGDLAHYMKLGRELGLDKEDLMKFATEQLKEFREFTREQMTREKEKESLDREERRLIREEKVREDGVKMREEDIVEREKLRQYAEKEKERELRFESEEKQRKHVLESEERNRRHELELKRCEIDLLQLKNGQEIEVGKQQVEISSYLEPVLGKRGYSGARVPKLPFFNADTDDIDSYLIRFEHYAMAQSWDKDQWATNLGALLTGKSLEVYARRHSTRIRD